MTASAGDAAEGEPNPTPPQRAAALGARLDELLAAGDSSAACELVASSFAERSDAGDLPEVAALISALPDAVLAASPRVLIELARACDAEARVRLRTRLLERAERLPTPPDFAAALDAERIADLARDTRADEVEPRVQELERALAALPDSVFVREARARSSHALGRIRSWRGDPASVAAAEDALQVAAGTARELGRHEWRAQSLLTLGFGVHFLRGEELRATTRLREAIDLLPAGHPRRASVLSFLAEAYVRTHLLDDALPLLEEMQFEAAETGDQRALGYAAWTMAALCAERGEAAATLEWLAEAERHPGDWFAHSTGGEFLAEAAIAAERVGEVASADRYLERARERAEADGYPEMAWYASGLINARRGDVELAITNLTRLLDEPWFPPREKWSAWLHLALARLRAGDERGASQDAARGFAAASALVGPGRAAATADELPALLTTLEADLVRRLAPIAALSGSTIAAAVQPVSPRVRLFGGLAVRVGGTTVPVPEGRPAQLLMLVALSRTPIAIDVALEELWPDVAGDVGRRRIRNVLARLRASCGDLLVRTGESLALAPDTVVDVTEFEQACDRTDRARPSEKPALARAALATYRSELLPEAAYAPRVVRVRDALNRRAIGLLDIVATAAERAGRVDEAVAALARIAELDPYDDGPPARAAELLARAGRAEQAAEWHDRARAAVED